MPTTNGRDESTASSSMPLSDHTNAVCADGDVGSNRRLANRMFIDKHLCSGGLDRDANGDRPGWSEFSGGFSDGRYHGAHGLHRIATDAVEHISQGEHGVR